MERSLLPFLDLMFGFVGVMLIMVAISNSDDGSSKILEEYHYCFVCLECESTSELDWVPEPQANLWSCESKQFKPRIARRGAKKFDLMFFVNSRSNNSISVLDEAIGADLRFIEVKMDPSILSDMQITACRAFGDLEPIKGLEIASRELLDSDYSSSAWLSSFGAQLQRICNSATNGFRFNFN
ncbi:MAG: hypothetical protein KDB22_11830 [Planctomycetales bacterium]|nr:hypothetical protein [Planctomycetales bacterium]